MDADYINTHLIKWAKLIYGKNSDCFSKMVKKKNKEYFIFGSEKKKIKNKVSKEVALLLVTSK